MIYTGKWKCFWPIKEKSSVPTEIRFEYSRQKAIDLLLELNITKLPIDLNVIISEFSDFISIYSWTEAKKILKNDDPLHLKQKKVSGRTIRGDDGGYSQYVIVYDNVGFSSPYKGRPSEMMTRWTIAHELGHIFLEHLCITDIIARDPTSMEYHVLEQEANFFAAELLMPTGVYRNINPPNSEFISLISRVSGDASQRREWYFTHDYYLDRDDLVFRNFFNYLNSEILDTIMFEPFDRQGLYMNQREKCKNCGYVSFGLNVKYCMKCGEPITYGNVSNKHYNFDKFFYDGVIPSSFKKKACTCGKKNLVNYLYCVNCGLKSDNYENYLSYAVKNKEVIRCLDDISHLDYLVFEYWDFIRFKMEKHGVILKYALALVDDEDNLHIITKYPTFSISIDVDFIRAKLRYLLDKYECNINEIIFDDLHLF